MRPLFSLGRLRRVVPTTRRDDYMWDLGEITSDEMEEVAI